MSIRRKGLKEMKNGMAHLAKQGCSQQDDTDLLARLNLCTKHKDLVEGIKLHASIRKLLLLQKSPLLARRLVNMYVKCGALGEAREVLMELPVRDAFSWTALIAGYTQQGHNEEALKCLDKMQREGQSPDAITFACALKACANIGAIGKAERIHDEIIRLGLLKKDIVLGTALMDVYAKGGALVKAAQLLGELPVRDAVAWSSLIAGYAQYGLGEEALECFDKMQQEGHFPDAVTYISVLKACAIVGAIDKGEQIHQEVVRLRLLESNILLGTTLIDMYAKCGVLNKAQQVLDQLPARSAVSWSAMIAGYTQQGQPEEALRCFDQMQSEGHSADAVTYTFVLKACASAGAVDKGQQIHEDIMSLRLLDRHVLLGTALIDMYAKCGALRKAQLVLDQLPDRDGVAWTALVAGYTQQGHTGEVLSCFECMQCEGITPNPTIFLCGLTACSHSGLLDEGEMCYATMDTKYGIIPESEHHSCMVDLFGRAGQLNKALQVIKGMPSCDYLPAWVAFLGACRKWENVRLGGMAFKQTHLIDKTCAGAYVCMHNIYSAAGMQEDAKKIEAMLANEV